MSEVLGGNGLKDNLGEIYSDSRDLFQYMYILWYLTHVGRDKLKGTNITEVQILVGTK